MTQEIPASSRNTPKKDRSPIPNHTALSFRSATEADFPDLEVYFEELNATYYQLGYLLPQPEKVSAAWVDSFRRTLGRFSNVFIAELNGDMVGFALCRLKKVPQHMGGVTVGELSDIWISAKARRLGIGYQLTQMVLDWLHEQGVHSVEVQVLRENEPAWNLFEKMGFQLEYRAARLIF